MTTTETQWNGPVDTRVAVAVPADVQHAIDAYETALARRQRAEAIYQRGHRDGDLADVMTQTRLMDQWWRTLEALLPMEAGWYPHAGRLYGYAKRSWRGLELVREPGSCPWPDPVRSRASRRAQAERARAESQLAEFVRSTRDR